MGYQLVEVPGFGEVEFPDSMSDDDIAVAIQKNILKKSPTVQVTEDAAEQPFIRPAKIPISETRDRLTSTREITKGTSIAPITSDAGQTFSNSSGAAAFAQRVEASRKQKLLNEQQKAGEMAKAEAEWLPTDDINLSLRETPGKLAARKVGVDRPALAPVGDVFAATAPITRPLVAKLSGRTTTQQLGKEYLEAEEAAKQRKLKKSMKPEELKVIAGAAKWKLGRGEEISEDEARAIEADKPFMDSLREMATFVQNHPGDFGKELAGAFITDGPSFLLGMGAVRSLKSAYTAAKATGRSIAVTKRFGEGTAAAKRVERLDATRRGVEASKGALVKPTVGKVATDVAIEEAIVPTAVGASKEAAIGRDYTPAQAVQDVLISAPFAIPHLAKLRGKQPLTTREWDQIARVVRRQDLEKHPDIKSILPTLLELSKNPEFEGRLKVTPELKSIGREEAKAAYGKGYVESLGPGKTFQVAGETGTQKISRAEEQAGAVPKGEAHIYGRGGPADVVEEAAHLAEERIRRLAPTDEKMGAFQNQIAAWTKHARSEAEANGITLPNDREMLAQAYAVSKGHGKEYPEVIRFLKMPESIRKKFDALVLARESEPVRKIAPEAALKTQETVATGEITPDKVSEIFNKAKAEAEGAAGPATQAKKPDGFIQMSVESQPGESVDYLPGIHAADLGKRTEYHDAIIKSITNEKTGKNAILESYDIPEAQRIDAPGAWKKKTNPSSQYLIPIEGLDDAQVAELETRVGAAANAMRKALRQEAVAYHRPVFKSADVADQNGVQVDIGRSLTPAESQAFYDKIMELSGRDDLAPIAWAGGARVLNFPEYSGIDNAALHQYIEKAAEATLPDSKVKFFTSKGDLVDEAGGAKYEQSNDTSPGRAGRSDIQRGVYADRFERASRTGEEFGKRYGWSGGEKRSEPGPAAKPQAFSLKPEEQVNPIPREGSRAEKAEALFRLSHKTKPVVDPVLKKIDEALGTKSVSDVKQKATMLEKVERPATKKLKPWMDVEHITDGFRYKTVADTFDDIQKALDIFLDETGAYIVKSDLRKFARPTELGFRNVSFDLLIPSTGQITEYQLILREMDEFQETVHPYYQKWRVVDPETASLETRMEWMGDTQHFTAKGEEAWNQALERLGLDDKAFEASVKSFEIWAGSLIKRNSSWGQGNPLFQEPPRRMAQNSALRLPTQESPVSGSSEAAKSSGESFMPSPPQSSIGETGGKVKGNRAPESRLYSLKPEDAAPPKPVEIAPSEYKVGPEAVVRKAEAEGKFLGPRISYEAGPGEVKSGFITPAEKLYTEGVNEAFPLEKIQNLFEKESGKPVRPEESIKFAVNQVLGSGGSARFLLQKHLKPIFQGGEVDGVKYAALTPDEARLVDKYALARDNRWRWNQKNNKWDNPAMPRETAQKIIRDHDALPPATRAKIEGAANGLVRYAKHLAYQKMKMGLWDEVEHSRVTKNPYYIPEIRDFEKVSSKAIGKAKKDAFSSTNKLLRGTMQSDLDAPVFDPVTALIHDTGELESEGAKMKVWNRAIDLAEKSKELSGWIRRMPKDYTPAANEGEVKVLRNRTIQITSDQMTTATAYGKAKWFVENQESMERDENLLRQEHQNIYKRINALPQEKKSRLGGSMEGILERVAKSRAVYLVKRRAEAVKIMDDFKKLPAKERLLLEDWIDQGKPQSFLVPIEVAEAVKGMAPMEWAFWQKPMVAAASVFRKMTVGWNPDFSFSNVPRDAQEAFYNVGLKPWTSLKGLYHYFKKDKIYDTFMEHGGAMEGDVSGFKPATGMSQEIRYGNRPIRDRYKKVMDSAPWEERKITVFGKELNIGQLSRMAEGLRQTVKMPFELAEAIGEAGEMMTRLGVMDMALKGKKLTPDEAVALSRTATLDFRRIGSKMKSANAMIPFLNARIQGFDRLLRTAKQDPAGAATRAFISAAVPATALLAWNMRNPNYQDIPAWEKEYYWIFMKGKDGEAYFKIAKGFLAQLIVNPIQMTVENLAGTAKKDWWKIGLSVLKSGLPVDDVGSTINPVLKIPLEIKANYDFYFDRDIVKDPGKPRGYQYDQSTAETMKTVGEALNLSPAQMQHVAKTLLGGTATNILFVLDYALGKTGVQPENKIDVAYAPFVKRVFGVTKDWKSDLAQKQRKLIREVKLKKETYGKNFAGEPDIERGVFMKQIRQAEGESREAGVAESKRVDKESEVLLTEIDALEKELAVIEVAIAKTSKLQAQLLKKRAEAKAKGEPTEE